MTSPTGIIGVSYSQPTVLSLILDRTSFKMNIVTIKEEPAFESSISVLERHDDSRYFVFFVQSVATAVVLSKKIPEKVNFKIVIFDTPDNLAYANIEILDAYLVNGSRWQIKHQVTRNKLNTNLITCGLIDKEALSLLKIKKYKPFSKYSTGDVITVDDIPEDEQYSPTHEKICINPITNISKPSVAPPIPIENIVDAVIEEPVASKSTTRQHITPPITPPITKEAVFIKNITDSKTNDQTPIDTLVEKQKTAVIIEEPCTIPDSIKEVATEGVEKEPEKPFVLSSAIPSDDITKPIKKKRGRKALKGEKEVIERGIKEKPIKKVKPPKEKAETLLQAIDFALTGVEDPILIEELHKETARFVTYFSKDDKGIKAIMNRASKKGCSKRALNRLLTLCNGDYGNLAYVAYGDIKVFGTSITVAYQEYKIRSKVVLCQEDVEFLIKYCPLDDARIEDYLEYLPKELKNKRSKGL